MELSDSNMCTICLSENNKEIMELDCGHKFHKNCLREWVINQNNIILGHPDDDLAVKGTCPLCRGKFSKVFLSDNYYKDFEIKPSAYPIIFLKSIIKIFRS